MTLAIEEACRGFGEVTSYKVLPDGRATIGGELIPLCDGDLADVVFTTLGGDSSFRLLLRPVRRFRLDVLCPSGAEVYTFEFSTSVVGAKEGFCFGEEKG